MLQTLNVNFERQLEKTQKEHEKKILGLNDEIKKLQEQFDTREKELKKKIEQGLLVAEDLKQEIAKL